MRHGTNRCQLQVCTDGGHSFFWGLLAIRIAGMGLEDVHLVGDELVLKSTKTHLSAVGWAGITSNQLKQGHA